MRKNKTLEPTKKLLLILSMLTILPLSVTTLVADVIWQDDFSSYNSSQYYTSGMAYYNSDDEDFVLTNNSDWTRGRIYFNTPFEFTTFTAEFDIKIGGGSGADGIVFGFVPNYTYPTNNGGSMDFTNTNGYGIEFDTYFNSGDISEEHLGVLYNRYDNRLYQCELANGELEDNQWHHIVVIFNMGLIIVNFDGNEKINYQISSYQSYTGYFGFSAATGASTNWHIIDNVYIISSDWIEPPQNLEATSIDNSIKLTWDASSSQNIIKYNIYRDTNPEPTQLYDYVNAPQTHYFDNSVFTGNMYYYRATAVNNQNEESYYSNQAEGWIDGQYALDYDAVGNHVSIPPLNLNSNTITIDAWIKRNGEQSDFAGIFFSRDGNTVAGISITNESSNNELRYHWNGIGWNFNSDLSVPDNQWSHVALVINPTFATLYLNGDSVIDYTSHTIEEFNGTSYIGKDSYDNRNFKGQIDEVRMWKRELTQQEIQNRMYRELDMSNPADTTGLVGYWDFNEGIGDIAHDKTQYANNGTLVNGPQWVEGFNFTTSIINIVASYIIDSQETVFDTVEIELGETIGNLHFNEDQTLLMSGHGLLEGVDPDDYDFVNSRTFYIMLQLLNNQNVVGTYKTDNFEIPELPASINHHFDITYKLEILTSDSDPNDNIVEKDAEIWVADFEYEKNNYYFTNKGVPPGLIGKTLTIDGLGSFWFYSGDLFDLILDMSTENGLCYGMASSAVVYKNNPDMLPGYPGNIYTYQLNEFDPNVEYNIRIAFRKQKFPLIKSIFYDKSPIHTHHINSERELSYIKEKLEINKLVVGAYDKHSTIVHTLIKSGTNYYTYDHDSNIEHTDSTQNLIYQKNVYVPTFRGYFEEIGDDVSFLSTQGTFFFDKAYFSLNSNNFGKEEFIDPEILDSLMAWELDSLIVSGQNLLVYQENETELMDSSYVAEIIIENGLIESYDFGSYKAFYIDNSVQPNIIINADNDGSFSIMGINTSSRNRNAVTQFLFENITFPNDNSNALIPSVFSSGSQTCQIDYDNDGIFDASIENSYNGNVPSAYNFPPDIINDIPILNFRSNFPQNSINLLNYIEDEFPDLLNYSLDYDGSIFDASIVDSILTVFMIQNFDNIEIINLTVSDDLYSIMIPIYARFDNSPPSTPTDVQINLVGNDVILNWSEVTTTIYGSPIYVDFYLIFGSEIPQSDYIFLNSTTDTTFIHSNVGLFNDKMFYYIEAFCGTRKELNTYIKRNIKSHKKRW